MLMTELKKITVSFVFVMYGNCLKCAINEMLASPRKALWCIEAHVTGGWNLISTPHSGTSPSTPTAITLIVLVLTNQEKG